MPGQAELGQKYKRHLLRTVGKKPTKKEMAEVNKKIRVAFDRIYNSPDKPLSLLRGIYNRNLSKLWSKLVANEGSTSEIMLFYKLAKPKPASSIASLGSGLAVFELFIAKELAPQGRVYCIDLSEGMNRRAKQLKNRLKIKNASIITASATEIPLRSNSQDLVLARRTGLSNDKRWGRLLSESSRIMKKERGSLFIYAVDADFNKPTAAIKADLRRAKLKFVTMKGFRKGDGKVVHMVVAKLSR
jgi:SAM-dependent methyltransferase